LSEEHEAKVNPIAATNDSMSHLTINMDLYDVLSMIYDTKIANIFNISAIKCRLNANFSDYFSSPPLKLKSPKVEEVLNGSSSASELGTGDGGSDGYVERLRGSTPLRIVGDEEFMGD
jgi:hypothetical protein